LVALGFFQATLQTVVNETFHLKHTDGRFRFGVKRQKQAGGVAGNLSWGVHSLRPKGRNSKAKAESGECSLGRKQ